MLAERWTHPAIARLLLQAGADPNLTDGTGKHPLMMALESCGQNAVFDDIEAQTALLMLAKGADPNTRNSEHTALQAALDAHERDIVRQLIVRGADVNAYDHDGNFLLCHAGFDLYLTGLMLSRGADANAVDSYGRTVLMEADANITPLLLAWGANPNAQDKAGMTPLMYAAQEDNVPAVRLLLQHGANPHLRDRERKLTAAQYAEGLGCENAAGLLRTGKLLPPLPADANPNGDAKCARIRVDANHWLVRTRKGTNAYAFCLVNRAGRQGASISTFGYDPIMLSFRDVDGLRYVWVEDCDNELSRFPGGRIYLVKGLKLFEKWNEWNQYGLDCVPLPHGGALIRRHEPARYQFDWRDPLTRNQLGEVSRFRNGVVKELGVLDSHGE